MTSAPKNPRRPALLAALLIVAAVIVWRLGRPSPPDPSPPPPPVPASDSSRAQGATTSEAPTARSAAAPDTWQGPAKREGIDAANLYADAFVLFEQLTDEEKAMIRHPSEEVDAEKAAQLFEKIQAIMKLLSEAAKADYCDWGTGEITFETGLPHVNKSHDLAKLALWAAGYRFATDPVGAIDDLAARGKLGHHLSDTLFGVLVAASIERTANGLLQQHAVSADSTTLDAATRFLSGSTLDADLTRAMRGELSGVESFGKKISSMTLADRVATVLGMSSGDAKNDSRSYAERLTIALHNPRTIESAVATIRGIHKTAPDALRMPEPEFQTWLKDVESVALGGHPFVQGLVPSFSGMQRSIQQLRVERTLLTAGIDILQHGPAQVGRYRDPATGGALLYVPTPSGFELRSPYVAKGKPVTMEFRR